MWYNIVVMQQYIALDKRIFENYVDAREASRILKVHQETVKRLIRDGRLPAAKFGNKWIIERDVLLAFAGTYHGRKGRLKRLL